MPEAGAAVLRARYGARAVCTAHRDWADYLYMLDDLKTFPGKRFHGQRNHLNRFYKDNPGSRYVPITWMTLPRARAFLTEYVYRTPARSPIEAEEQCRAQELLEAVSLLQLQAGYLETARGDIVRPRHRRGGGRYACMCTWKRRDWIIPAPIRPSCPRSPATPRSRIPATATARTIPARRGCAAPRRRITPVAMIDKYWVNIAPARP